MNRLLRFTGLSDDSSGARANVNQLSMWLTAVSAKIEKYCNRNFEKKTYPQYFSYRPDRMELFLDALPAASITSIYTDGTGQFSGSESLLDPSQYTIGRLGRSVILLYPIYFIYPWREKTMQVNYVGGLATHGVNSVFTISNPVTQFTVGNYVLSDNGAVGLVKNATPATFTIENLVGVFSVGDSLVSRATENGANLAGVTATIQTQTSQSLVEAHPALAAACEMEVRYLAKHQHDLENLRTSKDGTLRRHSVKSYEYELLPEARAMLSDYQRVWVGD